MPIPLVVTKRYVQRSTGHIMVTTATQTNRDPNCDKKLCDSTSNGTDLFNVKTVHSSSNLLTPYREQPLDRLGLLSPTHDQRSQQQIKQITLQQSVLINRSKFLEATQRKKIRKIDYTYTSQSVSIMSYVRIEAHTNILQRRFVLCTTMQLFV